MNDAAVTPLADLVSHALERMEAGARMRLEEIPNDSSLSSSCHSAGVGQEVARLARIGAAVQPKSLNEMARLQHEADATWWHDPATGERITRNKGELLMLMVSEISEAMEGERKNLMDDKLPHRKMAEVELADTLIRIFGYAGAFGYDLDGAVAEKQAFNAQRADHKPENRLTANGKKW